MAVYSSSRRSSTDQLLMPSTYWNDEKLDRQSSERTIIWPEQPKFSSVSTGSVPVVYYLSRNGQLDHPHFIQVPLSSSRGLFLKDVLNKLNFIRGNGLAYMYSWSSKRSYKNGYVWQDLAEDDLIQPTNDHDYILKGSELLKPSTAVRPLPQATANEAHDSSTHRSRKSRLKNQSWSTFENPSSDSSQSQLKKSIHEGRLVFKSESSRELGGSKAWADMATQTEMKAELRRSKSFRERVHVNKSVELSREELSPPSMSSSEGLDGVSGSVDVDRSASVSDPTGQNESSGGAKIKPSRVLMQLLSCGYTAKENKRRGYSTTLKCGSGRTVLNDVVQR